MCFPYILYERFALLFRKNNAMEFDLLTHPLVLDLLQVEVHQRSHTMTLVARIWAGLRILLKFCFRRSFYSH